MVAQAGKRPRDSNMLGRMKEQALVVTEKMKSGAKALKDEAAHQAGRLGRAIKDEATRIIDDQKGAAASKIHSAGSAVEKVSRFLKAGKMDSVAEYVDVAAKTAESASNYLKQKDAAEVLEDLADLAKRHPAEFYGGLFLIGLAAGRFLKAGEPDEPEQQPQKTPQRQNRLTMGRPRGAQRNGAARKRK